MCQNRPRGSKEKRFEYDFKVNEGKWIARNRQDKDGRETNLRQPETFWYWDFKASETL